MESLWAPWRSAYILGETEATGACIFCAKPARGPEHFPEELILVVRDEAFVMLNKYPYNNGHLMIAPRSHVPSPADLGAPAHRALWDLTRDSLQALQRTLRPDGVNLGVNIGRTAGAGVADHCHVHLVPRWGGDTNFMPVIGETKVISQHLEATYRALLPEFSRLG